MRRLVCLAACLLAPIGSLSAQASIPDWRASLRPGVRLRVQEVGARDTTYIASFISLRGDSLVLGDSRVVPLSSIGRLERPAGWRRYGFWGLGIGAVLGATVGGIQFANSYYPCQPGLLGDCRDWVTTHLDNRGTTATIGALVGGALGAGIGFGGGYFASIDQWVDVDRQAQIHVSLAPIRNGAALSASIRF